MIPLEKWDYYKLQTFIKLKLHWHILLLVSNDLNSFVWIKTIFLPLNNAREESAF